jgi:hypothetical protein
MLPFDLETAQLARRGGARAYVFGKDGEEIMMNKKSCEQTAAEELAVYRKVRFTLTEARRICTELAKAAEKEADALDAKRKAKLDEASLHRSECPRLDITIETLDRLNSARITRRIKGER